MIQWLENAVFYEIYPQSFYDSNGDGIGDINGMIEKLDYVASLGVNAIWLNPWFQSPFRDGGYDISDFFSVAPRYGSNEDAKRFFGECHRRGIRVLLDLVIGHTAIEHPWFAESCKMEQNEFSDLFIWSPVVGWRGEEEEEYYISGWSPRGSFRANYFAVQPALNYGYNEIRYPWEMPSDSEIPLRNREVMKNIMRFWLDMGCDGFRVDMASHVVKRDPEFVKTQEFWQDFRAMFNKEYPEAILVSEWFDPHYSLPAGFHIDFAKAGTLFRNFDNQNADPNPVPIIMSRNYRGGLAEWLKQYEKNYQETLGQGVIGFFSGNHDFWRMRHYAEPENMIVNMALLFTMPGCPFLYYGDELGMRYLPHLHTEGSGARAGSRTPMQWNRSANLGFSRAPAEKLYLPVDPATDAPVVSEAEAGKNVLFTAVKVLISLHTKEASLRAGAEFELLHGQDDVFPLIYRRFVGKNQLLVALNPTGKAVSANCGVSPSSPPIWSSGKAGCDGETIQLGAVSAAIWRL